ncbi:MAG: triose-phosphate isomerase [Deltaproteobacteria bacterium]|nr:triose-phosphate isomerase [Deltaproteobacteria bacterium]
MSTTNQTRRPLVAGNWKLHKTIGESVALVREIKTALAAESRCEVVVAPVFTALAAVRDEIKGSVIKLSAQNVFWESRGAFTGEVSALLLRDVGCDYVIVGHSERRQLFGETDASVNKKVKAVLASSISVIVCVGESLEERKAGKTLQIVSSQVRSALDGLALDHLPNVVIAYEPVWAIGTGVNAEPEEVQQAHETIRGLVAKQFNDSLAKSTRILYGGSVKPENADLLMGQPDVDGALVGGASLTADSFIGIVKAAG